MSDNTIAVDEPRGRARLAAINSRVGILGFASGAVIMATALLTLRSLVRRTLEGSIIASSSTTQYWVSYSDGFVRRGLPGEVLREVLGGPPTAAGAFTTAAVLALIAVLSLAIPAWQVAGRVQGGERRLAAVGLIVASPFTLSLVARDIGRYDALAWAAIVTVGAASRLQGSSAHRGIALILMAVASILATASLEFAILPITGVIVIALLRQGYRGWRLFGTLFCAIGPACGVAVASLLSAPSRTTLISWMTSAGSTFAGADLMNSNAITALAQRPEGLTTVITLVPPVAQILYLILFSCCFAGSIYLLWGLTGFPKRRMFLLTSTFFAFCAVALSVVGVDYRRWWALAFVALLTALVMIASSGDARANGSLRTRRWLVVVVLLISLAAQPAHLGPTLTKEALNTLMLNSLDAGGPR